MQRAVGDNRPYTFLLAQFRFQNLVTSDVVPQQLAGIDILQLSLSFVNLATLLQGVSIFYHPVGFRLIHISSSTFNRFPERFRSLGKLLLRQLGQAQQRQDGPVV